jgi:hypothetical protein
MRESDILYQRGAYWVCKAPRGRKGFEVYRDSDSGTHAVRVASIGYPGELGLEKARAEVDRRATP